MSTHTKVARHLAWMLFAAIALMPWAAPSAQAPVVQKYDAEYTALIKQSLTDPRINTELVDHLPASDKVPTPLKFRPSAISPASPATSTYAKDIHAYIKAIADAEHGGRAKFWVIGQTEEGRDQVVLAIANEDDDQEPRPATRATCRR